jgi:hypothetical protein
MLKNRQHRAITITFGSTAENGPGMEHVTAAGAVGKAGAGDGLTYEDIQIIRERCDAQGMKTRLISLDAGLIGNGELHKRAEQAHLLVVEDMIEGLGRVSPEVLFEELTKDSVHWDAHALMRGQVKNKLARHNICISDYAQTADYQAGKGTVVAFEDLPTLKVIRENLGKLHPKLENLPAEGNDYFDARQCGIGFHGDAERPLTVGMRLYGSEEAKIQFHYQWYQNSKPVGQRMSVELPNGSGYFMCEKATGFDWKKTANGRLTLRHAAAGEGKKTKRFLRPEEIEGEILYL